MRKIICYIATSLDGKIADVNGNVDWLEQIPNPDKSDYGYQDFLNTVDCTIMGNNTYQKILGFDIPFPYQATKNYVLTRNKDLKNTEHVEFISENVIESILKLKKTSGKNIWCIGGGALISSMLNHKLIDEFIIFIMPAILGNGIPLVGSMHDILNLKKSDVFVHKSGVIEARYRVELD